MPIKVFARFMSSISLVFLLTSCGSDKNSGQAAEPVVRPVKLITVAAASSRLSNRYPAVIDAAQSSNLTFEVGGLIEDVLVTESQDVKKGVIIAKLRQRDFRNNLDSAQAQFKNADTEYQRALRLAKENAIAKNVLDQRKAQRDVAKSSLDSAKKALEDTVLRAPFDGAIAELPVKKLQTVQPGTVVASVIDLSTLEAAIDLPASIIATVEQRQDKQAFVLLDAAPDSRIEATFKEATLLADALSQTYKVTFSFTAPESLLILPGMNATMILESSGTVEAANVALPLAAILSDGDQQFVWVVDQQSMSVSKRAVELTPGIGDTLVVKKGLSPGDVIAGAGATYLAEGMTIRPWE
ncbi:MAG: efflux RND transporter periplasmic adaptor subunit [Cellvibrionaceae bacterium]